jgi:hypothetical protein
VRTARTKSGKTSAPTKPDAAQINREKEKALLTIAEGDPQMMRHFRGPPLQFDFQLVPGLETLVAKAAAFVRDADMSLSQQIADASQEIADGAVGFFHAVLYLAGLGHPWAIRILTEFAISATGAIEAIIERRSPKEEIPFAAVLSIARENRRFPVLIRRHAKAHNQKKLKLPEIVQLGGGLGERINKRKPSDPARPINRVIDAYLTDIRTDPQLHHDLPPLRRSKPVCRKWALRILDLFEQNNGPAIKRPAFTPMLKYGPKTDKGKRGAIRDAIQNALFRRQIEV